MIISLIAAMDKNRGIGFNNTLPWAGKTPRDMARFKELTTGHTVIMGRKTFESIGKPLKDRKNIVLSRNHSWCMNGVATCSSLTQALTHTVPNEEVFIIGGETLYREALPLANRLYLTEIDGSFICDAFFPDYDPLEWRQTSLTVHHADDRNKFKLRFFNFERKTAP